MTTTTAEHPIYAAARAEYERTGRPWIDTADVAKLIRLALDRAYPTVRFYVTLSRYSGGSSIQVAYDGVELDERGNAWLTLVDYDGIRQPGAPAVRQDLIDYNAGRWGRIPRPGMPSKRDVAAITAPFAGRSFDGMIDLAYSLESWLNPDGSMTFASNSGGTEASHGSVPAVVGSRRHPSAVLVHSGSSYVFVDDELPYSIRRKRDS